MRCTPFSVLALLIWLLAPFGAVQAEPPPPPQPAPQSAPTLTALSPVWKEAVILPEAVRTVIGLVARELETIPSEAAEESPDGQRRTAMKKRQGLLRELEEILRTRQTLLLEEAAEPERQRELKRLSREVGALPDPAPPASPSEEGFARLKEELSILTRRVEELTARRQASQERLEQIPQWIHQARERRKEAEENAARLAALGERADGAHMRTFTLRMGNAELAQRLEGERIALWEAQQAYAQATAPPLDLRIELEKQRRDWLMARYRLYQAALAETLAKAQAAQELALADRQEAVELAEEPTTRFLAEKALAVARVERNITELIQLKTRLGHLEAQQEALLKAEQQELENLRRLVTEAGGVQGAAADLLTGAFRLVGQRRMALGAVLSPALAAIPERLQARRLEVDRELAALGEPWRQALGVLDLDALSRRDRAAFNQESNAFQERLRERFAEERRLAFEALIAFQRLELLPEERGRVLTELESFVLSNLFWIQDADPFGPELLNRLRLELFSPDAPGSLLNVAARLLAPEAWSPLRRQMAKPLRLAALVGLLLALPTLVIPLRRRIRREARLAAELRQERPRRLGQLWLGGADAALIPLWLSAAALLTRRLDLPEDLAILLPAILLHVAVFQLFLRLNRLLFTQGGLAESALGLPEDLADNLRLVLRISLFAYVVFLLPWALFHGPRFGFEALPRVGFLLFEASVGLVVYHLIRPASPLVRHAFAHRTGFIGEEGGYLPGAGWLASHWTLLSRVTLLFLVALIIMDVMGYRFGAAQLAKNGLLTLVTLFGLIGLYRFLARALFEWTRTQNRVSAAAPGESAEENQRQLERDALRFLKLVLILGGLALMASYWNLNNQVLEALSGGNLYSVTGDEGQIEFVTSADLMQAVVAVGLTFWLAHYLPGLFGFLLFSWWRIDQGSRYAVVTIGRYLFFLVGFLVAGSWLRLDPGKISVIVAAISVGLGFGLQEIVANFVSGVILLMERPIRVGDFISAGGVEGQVSRVNIRATTVINWDLQEILIPNRDLISNQVTNWTLNNSQCRVIIPIGVAYGSDVDRVEKVLMDIAQSQPETLLTPPPQVLFMLHGESSLDFELRVYLPHPNMRLRLISRLNRLINKRFIAEGIAIPFPQRDLHIHGLPAREVSSQVGGS